MPNVLAPISLEDRDKECVCIFMHVLKWPACLRRVLTITCKQNDSLIFKSPLHIKNSKANVIEFKIGRYK